MQKIVLIKIILLGLAFPIGSYVYADEEWECKVTDYEGTDAELENAGVNPRCPDISVPWACYCKVEETCEERKSGKSQIFRRREFMFCGTLSQCNIAWTTTYCH